MTKILGIILLAASTIGCLNEPSTPTTTESVGGLTYGGDPGDTPCGDADLLTLSDTVLTCVKAKGLVGKGEKGFKLGDDLSNCWSFDTVAEQSKCLKGVLNAVGASNLAATVLSCGIKVDILIACTLADGVSKWQDHINQQGDNAGDKAGSGGKSVPVVHDCNWNGGGFSGQTCFDETTAKCGTCTLQAGFGTGKFTCESQLACSAVGVDVATECADLGPRAGVEIVCNNTWSRGVCNTFDNGARETVLSECNNTKYNGCAQANSGTMAGVDSCRTQINRYCSGEWSCSANGLSAPKWMDAK